MKRIILFLALALGVKVNAQVVGGYLPINSTKSATMGGLKVNGNETVTGTFSVGSTATITGALNVGSNTLTSSTATLGPTKFNGAIVSDGSGISAGSGQITNVTNLLASGQGSFNSSVKVGSTTIIGGASNATLTGGNTGTVAVLSDLPVTFNMCSASWNPADGTTGYIGCVPALNPGVTQGQVRIYIPYNVTFNSWSFNGTISTTPSSSETSTISLGVSNSYTTLSSSVTFTTVGGTNTYSNTGISINANTGDYLELRIVNPTWATNPTGLCIGFVLYGYRRQ